MLTGEGVERVRGERELKDDGEELIDASKSSFFDPSLPFLLSPSRSRTCYGEGKNKSRVRRENLFGFSVTTMDEETRQVWMCIGFVLRFGNVRRS